MKLVIRGEKIITAINNKLLLLNKETEKIFFFMSRIVELDAMIEEGCKPTKAWSASMTELDKQFRECRINPWASSVFTPFTNITKFISVDSQEKSFDFKNFEDKSVFQVLNDFIHRAMNFRKEEWNNSDDVFIEFSSLKREVNNVCVNIKNKVYILQSISKHVRSDLDYELELSEVIYLGI